MARTIHEKNYMKLVSNQLNLPVFLVSRNRIKSNLTPLRGYIGRKRLRYTKLCDAENATETTTLKKYKHIFGLEQAPTVESCPTRRVLKQSRDLYSKSSWLMAPNMYRVRKQPFARKKGLGGAFWRKLPTSQPLKKKPRQPQSTLYDINKEKKTCNRYKCIFMTNARNHRAAARSMVNDLSSCYRNPNDPAPNAYYPQNHTLAYNVSPPIISKPPNPHTFLRRSCVPAKQTYIDQKSRFEPGPGRFEIRYPNDCPCTWLLVIQPNLQLIIDREKRKKFRRLPYRKIEAHKYCNPDWRHVKGHGHSHIFKLPPHQKQKEEARKSKDSNKIDAKEAMKPDLQLYPDARYIDMINDPNRPLISFRQIPLEEPKPNIFFNCMKHYPRRGRIPTTNKKIAFNCGQDRFKFVHRTHNLTVSQLKKLINSLPVERQFRDQPVMQKTPQEIKSKLMVVPKYMQSNELVLRKHSFKFAPLPELKMLVTANEVEKQIPKGVKYFGQTLDMSSFFKNAVLLTSTSQG